MYLARTLRDNRPLVEAAIELHQSGFLPPACFLIDVDMVRGNTARVREAADRYDIDLYFMSKQIGHNPEVIEAIRAGGIDKTVAVDGRSAQILASAGVLLGNIGHLSQIPRHQLRRLLGYRPDVVTVFNIAQAGAVAKAATDIGTTQPIQLKVLSAGGPVFPGQDGGFTTDQIDTHLKTIAELEGVEVVGVTAYPCLDFDESRKEYVRSVLASELIEAGERLGDVLGIVPVINAPGSTSVEAMPVLAEIGATVAEPGHALTGTGPHHVNGNGPESPAIVFVSEVVQVDKGQAQAIGGGLYRRGRLANAVVGRDPAAFDDMPLKVIVPNPGYIDYHFSVETGRRDVEVGDTVVCAFRPQVFVTYTRTATISGLTSNGADLGPIRDSLGNTDQAWDVR